jgi:hypothetical protein
MMNQKQLENAAYFNCLGRVITNDKRCAHYIKSRIAITKAAFSKKTLFISKRYLNIRKKLVKCYSCSIAPYGVKFGHFREEMINTLKAL